MPVWWSLVLLGEQRVEIVEHVVNHRKRLHGTGGAWIISVSERARCGCPSAALSGGGCCAADAADQRLIASAAVHATAAESQIRFRWVIRMDALQD